MNASLITRTVLPLALVAALPLAAKAQHPDRIYDRIELFAKVGADQTRDLYKDIVRDISEPALRRDMMQEARKAMTGFAQVRVYAKQERGDRIHREIQDVHGALVRLDRLLGEVGRSFPPGPTYRNRQPDLRHMHRMVHSLTDRALIIDDMTHQLYGPPPYRFGSTDDTRSRPGFELLPGGMQKGKDGLAIHIGLRE